MTEQNTPDAMRLERAMEIARAAHEGQTDKAGAPYIEHPLRVMAAFKDPLYRAAAVLHDVVEDSAWTLADLRAEGFPEALIAAVDGVTRRDGESYNAFIDRAARDPVAAAVKRADLLDNLDARRLGDITPADERRLERYRKALRRIDRQLSGEPEAPPP